MGREEVEGHWEGIAGRERKESTETGHGGMPDEITVPVLFSWKCRPQLSNFRVKLSPNGWHPGELLGWPGQWPLSSVSVALEHGLAGPLCQQLHWHLGARGDEVQQSCSLLEREHARAGTGHSGTGTE